MHESEDCDDVPDPFTSWLDDQAQGNLKQAHLTLRSQSLWKVLQRRTKPLLSEHFKSLRPVFDGRYGSRTLQRYSETKIACFLTLSLFPFQFVSYVKCNELVKYAVVVWLSFASCKDFRLNVLAFL